MITLWRSVCNFRRWRFLPFIPSATVYQGQYSKIYKSEFPQILLNSFMFCTAKRDENVTQSASSEDEDLQYHKHLYNEVKNVFRYPDGGHNLMLIQPRVRHGEHFESRESAALMMNEAVALVQTLPDWTVVQKCIVSVSSDKSPNIFGKGQLVMLKEQMQQCRSITAIFIGVDMLSALQNTKLQEHFGLQVFDRYQIVLKIFHDHARTKEAKLQVALAEIPYLRVKLAAFSYDYDCGMFSEIGRAGGTGETPMNLRRRLLNEREKKLKRALERLRKQREFLRRCEHRNKYPIVAVVGYTNCGKTSLIKCLSGDVHLTPEDKLFATLDVTVHAGTLPSFQKVLYVDTVGFISRIPTTLIHSFQATLEDISGADIIIHVRDISHPHTEMHKKVVLETLKGLNITQKLFNSIIEVGNKVDLLEKWVIKVISNQRLPRNYFRIFLKLEKTYELVFELYYLFVSEALFGVTSSPENAESENLVLISATKGDNLNELVDTLEQKLIENTDHGVRKFRVPNGGEAYSWLRREATIRQCIVDESDYNYLLLEVVLSKANLAKFTKQFGDLTHSLDQIKVS